MSEIRLVRATMRDRPQISALLRSSFYRHEPLNVAMGLTDAPSDADVNHSLQSLPQGNSWMALDAAGHVVGVALNGDITDKEVNVRKKLYDECECKEFASFLKFWVHVESVSKFWEKTDGVKKALDLEIIAVEPASRGSGIGKMLMDRTRAMAKELGYSVLRVDCSSHYAARLAEQQGMTRVFQLNYSDYRDESGQVVFKIDPPHRALQIYMQRL